MIGLIEKLSIIAWPALDAHLYDGWLICASKGYTRRANSVNIVGSSKIPLDEKIRYCEQYYAGIGLPAMFKIIHDKSFEELDYKLHKRGYGKAAPTSVRIKNLSGINFCNNTKVETEFHPSDKWIDEYFECCQKDVSLKSIFSLIVKKIKTKGIWAAYKQKGKAAGFGMAVIERGYCGIYNLIVAEEFRGRGYAHAIMNKLLYEAKRLGAGCSYLQVEEGNRPAEMLYDKMGYEKAYQYYYRKSE